MSSGPRRLPGAAFWDLFVVVALAVGTAVVALQSPIALPDPVRVVLGFLFVFVLPGHAVTAALYPRLYESRRDGPDGQASALSVGNSLVLTVGLSVFVVPLSVLLVEFSPLAITPRTTLGVVAVVTAAAALVAAARRYRAAPRVATGVPVGRALGTVFGRARANVTGGPSAAATAVVLLVVSAGLAGGALVDTASGERYTELSLLGTENATAPPTADDYPSSIAVGDSAPLVVSVGNHEGVETRYSIVVQLEEIADTGDEQYVIRSATVDRLSLTVDPGEVERRRPQITVGTGHEVQRHRLVVLLYKGDPPDRPAVENAYRHTHIWVTVTS